VKGLVGRKYGEQKWIIKQKKVIPDDVLGASI
jgi:hypothetical protein